MKLTLRASGLIKSGPERDLIDDYLHRCQGLAPRLGLKQIEESAIDTRKAKTRADETKQILAPYQSGCSLILLDERGKNLSSREMSSYIARQRDDGVSHLVFAIGGADGFEPSALPPHHQKWSFGQQVWPHKLVRVMLAEQLYRCLSIMAGSPYHRD